MNKKQNVNVIPGVALVGAMALVGGCAMNSVAQEASLEDPKKCEPKTNEVCVNIRFLSNGCPDSVDNNNFVIDGNKFVVWQSVELSEEQDPTGESYTIYFDPFKGNPLKSNNGRKKSTPIDSPITEAGIEYKYTIIGENCQDEPLDPRFTVRK